MTTADPRASIAYPPAAAANGGPPAKIEGPVGWKRRLEDPSNTHYRYPIALGLTRMLVHTRVTPNQVSLAHPFFAAGAGYLVTFDDWRAHVAAAALFEVRSILDCVDGSLARAKKTASPNGHAIDAVADWVGVMFLYLGIAIHFWNHPAPGFTRMTCVAVAGLALAQGALRSVAFDYFKTKYVAIFERSRDEAPELLRTKVRALGPGSSLFAHIDVGIMRVGHLFFELEWFSPERSKSMSADAVARMASHEHAPKTRFMALLWSVSGGDAFLTCVVVSLALGQLWAAQVFFATIGTAWILAVVAHSVLFVRRYRAEGALPAV